MTTLDNVQDYLSLDSINRALHGACQGAIAAPTVMRLFMQRFVRYSAAHNHSLLELCSAIGMSQYFQDLNAAMPSNADRSMDVAAKVCAASIE